MLKIQNSLPVANQVKFQQNPYSHADIDSERDRKLDDINGMRNEFDSLATTLDSNPDKVSKKASKVVRFGATVLGLAATFVTAKYGSKIAINTFKHLANAKPVQTVIAKVKSFKEPAMKVVNTIKDSKVLANLKDSKALKAVKDSKFADAVKTFAKNDKVQKVLAYGQEYLTKAKTAVKSINGAKVQSVFENTMGASAAASVLIDDLAGRNDDKSNFAIAMGASGGDK